MSQRTRSINTQTALGLGGGLGGLQPWLYVREGSQQPPGAELSEVKGFHESW